MLAVAGATMGTLVMSAQSEAVCSNPACEAAYEHVRHGRPFPIAFPAIARALRRGHVVVIDPVMSDQELLAAQNDVKALLRQGDGAFAVNANDDSSVRLDSVAWVTGEEAGTGPGLKHAVALLKGLAHEFSRTPEYSKSVLFVQSAAQLACYAGDGQAFYAPHLDASTESIWTMGLNAWLRARAYRERTITAILYLNDKDWDADLSGGCLRCYLPSALAQGGMHDKPNGLGEVPATTTSGSRRISQDRRKPKAQVYELCGDHGITALPVSIESDRVKSDDKVGGSLGVMSRDVAPRGGRLVLFDSGAVLHEVLPSYKKGGQRIALTVWVSDRQSRKFVQNK